MEEEASVSNVTVSQSDTIEQEETEQEEVEPGEETQEASISEMLESQLESPREQFPKEEKCLGHKEALEPVLPGRMKPKLLKKKSLRLQLLLRKFSVKT